MERVLEGAVEHGVTVTRDRLQALAQVPAEMLVSDNAHARGFRLEGYGVFFDVVVPSLSATLTWSLRTLDQNDLGLDSALRALQSHIKTGRSEPRAGAEARRAAGEPRRARRAPRPGERRRARPVKVRRATGADTPRPPADDRSSEDPGGGVSHRGDAGADGRDARSQQLARHRAAEWLTVAAQGNDDRPRLAPGGQRRAHDHIRLRGSDCGVPGQTDFARGGAPAD